MPLTQDWLICHAFINASLVICSQVPADFGVYACALHCWGKTVGVRLLVQLPFIASYQLRLSGEGRNTTCSLRDFH